jgi:hypothetical protein
MRNLGTFPIKFELGFPSNLNDPFENEIIN